MSRRALARGGAVLMLLATSTLVSPREAGAWTEGPCTTASGVTVVIDFQELDGGVHTRCATGPVSSGFEVLQKAGIDYQTTVRFPGFVCKIAGKPTNDPCVNTSPASAYWSYWVAPRGGQWCYSNWGAGNRNPPEGTVEGWSFSLNRTASTSPPPRTAVPAHISGAPRALPANDCDQRSSAPTAPPTSAPRPRPAPTPVAPPTPTPGPRDPAPEPEPNAGATPGRSQEAPSAASGRPGADRPGTTAPAAAGTVGAEDSPEEVAGAHAERTTQDRGEAVNGRGTDEPHDEQAEAVDLSGDGEGPGSPVAVAVTVGVLGLLAAVTAVVRRRGSSR